MMFNNKGNCECQSELQASNGYKSEGKENQINLFQLHHYLLSRESKSIYKKIDSRADGRDFCAWKKGCDRNLYAFSKRALFWKAGDLWILDVFDFSKPARDLMQLVYVKSFLLHLKSLHWFQIWISTSIEAFKLDFQICISLKPDEVCKKNWLHFKVSLFRLTSPLSRRGYWKIIA